MQDQYKNHEAVAIVDAINARLNDFDILALLRLLKHHGFDEQSWWFSSHNNIVSQNRLIQSVSLKKEKDEDEKNKKEHVFIEMNMGLLASTGIIPEHIRKFMDHPDVDDNELQLFLTLFDHILISNYLAQIYPQINSVFFTHFAHTKACYTRLQNMRREVSLHWLLNTAFPECNIDITMAPGVENECYCRPILGKMTLGSAIDTQQKSANTELTVLLTLRAEWSDFKFSWQAEMQKRITEWVIPWLQDFSMKIVFYLRRPRSHNSLKLQQQSVLGYDPFFTHNQEQYSSKLEQHSFSELLHQQTLPIVVQSPIAQPQWEESWRIRL
jgi:hypothetical protein